MSLKDIVFSFTCEQGTQKMTLAEFHSDPDYMDIFGRQSTPPQGRRTLFFGKNIFSFPFDYLNDLKKKNAFEEAERLYQDNPLKYYCPQAQEVVDFLNWRCDETSGTLKVLHAGVGSGKTVAGVICWLLSILPTEKDWPIFEFGVQRREYRGPLTEGGVAVMSYQISNHQNTIWPQVIRRWCPKAHISDYMTGKKSISWMRNPQITICETPVYFMVYGQRATAFTSQALDIIHWDEQTKESIFNNANDRVQRRGGFHITTMTPHYVDGQAETGAGSFLDRIRKGELDTALVVKFFQMNKLDVNNWVVTHEDKAACLEEYINAPMRQGNAKKLAEGKSKVYGEFHERSGLVFDDWNREVHVIEPFEVPQYWSYYRYHDHGRKEPNACLLVAVSEETEYFVVGEYYEPNKEIRDNAIGIIEILAGNEIARSQSDYPFERMTQHDIIRTMSDPRSLSKTMDNSDLTIQEEYCKVGLHLIPGSGQPVEKLIPLLGSLLQIRMDRKHFSTRKMGAPSVYIFSNCKNLVKEIENYKTRVQRVVENGAIVSKEKPVMKDDHAITCMLLLAADMPSYIPSDRKRVDIDEEDEYNEDTKEKPNKYIGW